MIELLCDRCRKPLASRALTEKALKGVRARMIEGSYVHNVDVDLCEKCAKEFWEWIKDSKHE